MSIRHPRTVVAVALSIAFSPAIATTTDEAAIVVTATRIPYRETEATYAAEVHTRRMIEQSGAQTLADYLGQHSSLTVMPSYGNRFTPTLEMRGYGLETGNQNIAVTIDGQRLNSIDLQPQLLGAVPLSSIERIEITKGSGSVMQGDGAMAGAINITTRPYRGISVEVRGGTHGAFSTAAIAGIEGNNFSLTVGADHDRHGGLADADSSGKKDASLLRTERAQLRLRPAQALELKLDTTSAHVDTRYQNPLTLAQFNANPAQNGGAAIYTNYRTDVARWRAGMEYALTDTLKLTLDHHRLDQQNLSTASWGSFDAGYDTTGNDIALIHKGTALDLVAGIQQADAARTQTIGFAPVNRTSKNNTGYFVQGSYHWESLTLSAGGRHETVDYAYVPVVGVTQRGSHRLSAWDFGVNHRMNGQYTVFANINQSFQAPDIDRFFNFGGAFNGLISPAKARTLTAGMHRVAGRGNKFKLAIFRANLNDEIYYDPVTFNNTNIDKSHKYGVEVQQFWQATPALAINANYAWTKALIDRENGGAGAYDGKEMPGVPRHSLNLSVAYAIDTRTDLTLSHAWRSKSYAISDFDNNNAQRQAAFESTGITLRYKRDVLDYFLTINNLFDRSNGVWGGDNTIYPVNHARSAIAGVRARF